MGLALVAVGGNVLDGPRGEVLARVCDAARGFLARGFELILTHGNGPQVGDLLLAEQVARTGHVPLSLDVLDAETQGAIGYRLQQALGNALPSAGFLRPVVSVVTQVVVDAADAAFATPTKPVGPFYGRDEAERLRTEKGWVLVEDAGRGYRRVVPSPQPLEVVEWPAVRVLLGAGIVVVAAGGGGVPVVREADGSLRGVEAVIDKDRASSLLARRLRADLVFFLTGVPEVRLDYGGPGERPLRELTVAEARRHLAAGQFAAGSMGPKVEAAADFVEATGKPAIITSAERALEALDGGAGTRLKL